MQQPAVGSRRHHLEVALRTKAALNERGIAAGRRERLPHRNDAAVVGFGPVGLLRGAVHRGPGIVADVADLFVGIGGTDINKNAGAEIGIRAGLADLVREHLGDRVSAGERAVVGHPRPVGASAIVVEELVLADKVRVARRMAGRHQDAVDEVDVVVGRGHDAGVDLRFDHGPDLRVGKNGGRIGGRDGDGLLQPHGPDAAVLRQLGSPWTIDEI